MKTLIPLAALALMIGAMPAIAAKEHCVTRNVTSNDNSLQGLSTVCIETDSNNAEAVAKPANSGPRDDPHK